MMAYKKDIGSELFMKISMSRSCLVELLGIVLLLVILIVPVAADTMRTESGTNRNGNDYANYTFEYCTSMGSMVFTCPSGLTYGGTASECSNLCLGQALCVAATYVQGDKTCWLKSSLPAASPNPGMTSFVKVASAVIKCAYIHPTADFTATPLEGSIPLDVQFTDQSSNAQTWSWDFGDGGTSTSISPSHMYTQAGTYTVTHTVTESCKGVSDTKTRTSYIIAKNQVSSAGYLDVSSTPGGARISINGADKGITSSSSLIMRRIILSPGTYDVHLTLSGYNDYSQSETINAGQAVSLTATLTQSSQPPAPSSTTGTLVITSIPDGAAVYIDSGSQGTTPTTISITAGSYTVKLTKSGYTDYQQPAITVAAGKTTPLNVNLVATTPGSTGTGSISIISSPSGASVNLDGWDKGTTPTTLDDVKAGSHTLTLTKTGYQDSVRTVPVTGGSTTEVTASLTIQDPGPQPSGLSTLTIRSTPVGANVYIDGETAGITPVKIQNVKAGTRKILLTLQSYPDNTQTVEITAGSDKEISIDLGTKKAPGFALPVSLAALAFTALVVLGRRKGR